MKALIKLTACLALFLISCSKDDVSIEGENYFIGSWEAIKEVPYSTNLMNENLIKVTFKKSGEALFYLPIGTIGNNPITHYWSYNSDLKELSFVSPEDKYTVIEKSTKQFKLVHKYNNNQLTFTRR